MTNNSDFVVASIAAIRNGVVDDAAVEPGFVVEDGILGLLIGVVNAAGEEVVIVEFGVVDDDVLGVVCNFDLRFAQVVEPREGIVGVGNVEGKV